MRIKKSIFLILSLLIGLFFITGNSIFAQETKVTPPKPVPPKSAPPIPPAVAPQKVDFNICNKFFKLNNQKLFYLTLSGINANRFQIDEIQTKSGYILFTAAKKQFLASVIIVDPKNSMLKITPCDNYYYFPIGIVQNMYKYIELNMNTPIEKLSTS